MTHPSQVGSNSPWTLAPMLLDTRCPTLARTRAPRSWSQLACALAGRCWPQHMLHSYYSWAMTFGGADAVFQQNGAPSHTACTTRALLGVFRETLACPAVSRPMCAETTTLRAFYGSLSSPQQHPTDATTLRATIIKTHAKITCDQVKRMPWHFTRRLRLCLAAWH